MELGGLKQKIKLIFDKYGSDFVFQNIPVNVIKVVYPNLTDLITDFNLQVYRFSSEGLGMYLNDFVVKYLLLDEVSGGERKLGDFTWLSNGSKYKFTAYLYPLGNGVWKVVGHSGDYGFGYSWISKRNTLGKRTRLGIYKQIIDKYNLDPS
jgi:hypothetical protein